MAESACAVCGADNRAGAKFCAECGSALASNCPQCGLPATGGRFCSECGASLAATTVPATTPNGASAPPASEPVSERRIVSLLFADLVGFTPLSENRDPEAVRELLSAYFERSRAVIERYGGSVEKFIGDAVFAVWGVPAAREDDAERAVRAGLDLISAVAALGEELKADGLQMRVGITTGQVAVTLGAVGQGMVAGDAVNTASRVQSAANPGEVWVDDPTRALTTASLAYEPAGSHQLKGKSVPMELFRAVRTTAVVGGEQRVDGLEAPFVGRDRELRMVKELFHATAEEKRTRFVLVAGEPGIGKSRIAWEFEKYLDAITSHVSYWLRGRCLSYGQGVAGRVVAEMIRSLLRVTDTDSEETVRAALDERLEQHVSDPAEREVLRPRLESLLGLSDRAFDQADMFACWRAFLEDLTHDGSLVTLVVEDLQWADDAFLDFLDHLLDAAQAPIMVLALARPEVTSRRAGIGAGRRSTTVYLEPLPDQAMRQLLDGLVGNLPATLRDELVRRADGIPLYAVETVRSLIDRDVVVPAGGRYVVDPDAAGALDLAELAPPASLHALLAARLDALPPDERRIVQDGSVLGLTFTPAALEALVTTVDDLDEVLSALRRKEILSVDTDPRSPERGQYRFVQALLRGVAYETLSRRDRKAKHIAAAEYLVTSNDVDAIAGVLAAHYLDAASAVPEDNDVVELRERAATLLERAATHATDVGAPVDALMHYAQLLELDVPDATLIRTACSAAALARRSGTRAIEVLEWVERAFAAAERSGTEDDHLQLRLARALLNHATGRDFAGCVADAEHVLEASIGNPDRVDLVSMAARTLCITAQLSGDYEQAQRAALRALEDIERYGDDNAFAILLDSLAMWFGLAGYRRLTGLVRRAAAGHYEARRDPTAISLFGNLAANLVPDDPQGAVEAASKAMETARAIGLNEIVGIGHFVAAATSLGRWPEALSLLRTRAAGETSQLVDWETYLLADSALLAWEMDDPSVLMPGTDTGKDSEDVVVAGWWLIFHAARTAFEDGVTAGAAIAAEAVEHVYTVGAANEDVPLAYSLAVEMLVEAGDLDTLARITEPLAALPVGQRFRLVQGQLLRAQAHLSDDPVAGLRQSVAAFDAMGAAFWAARTRVELAEALAGADEGSAAALVCDAAEPLLREIGAARALRQLDDVRARLKTRVPVA
ncbi:MAG TPA: adenylate/guanylate cyclase domain-containing protein [Mycobacteriales bacterium]|nr:adenylate/guanylate cyclase domain-containing protein [Mycobacteriales bacterium]